MLRSKKTIYPGLKLIILALFCCLFALPAYSMQPVPRTTRNATPSATITNYDPDINDDGKVNATDVQLVINATLGHNIGSLSADVNRDGKLDAMDVQLVINAALGIDINQPKVSITIDGSNPYTNNKLVTLTISAPSSIQMQFSNNNSTWSSPENYATTKSWTLALGDGTKTVYAKFKDNSGTWSKAYSASITLDTTPPQLTITSPQDNQIVTKQRNGTIP